MAAVDLIILINLPLNEIGALADEFALKTEFKGK